jgi:hypothetical protein
VVSMPASSLYAGTSTVTGALTSRSQGEPGRKRVRRRTWARAKTVSITSRSTPRRPSASSTQVMACVNA